MDNAAVTSLEDHLPDWQWEAAGPDRIEAHHEELHLTLVVRREAGSDTFEATVRPYKVIHKRFVAHGRSELEAVQNALRKWLSACRRAAGEIA